MFKMAPLADHRRANPLPEKCFVAAAIFLAALFTGSPVMTDHSQFSLLAAYNSWMNKKVYEAASRLSVDELMLDRRAFFGSIFGTLNHLVAGDTNWLKRFAAHPAAHKTLEPIRRLAAPSSLSALLYDDLVGLAAQRQLLDSVIEQWLEELTEADLTQVLRYSNMRGDPFERRTSALLMHFLNHQTHHRGQASTLLFQAGQDIGVTDLLMLIPNETVD
jgi:uncharacterized damage-inducible protein DinB